MNETGATFTMILLFALRCVAPVVLTVLIGWLMNRLVDRWEAEETAVTKQPKPSPEAPRRAISGMIDCWVFNNCEASDCEAYENPPVTCWKTKRSPSGQLLEKCESCPIYTRSAPAV